MFRHKRNDPSYRKGALLTRSPAVDVTPLYTDALLLEPGHVRGAEPERDGTEEAGDALVPIRHQVLVPIHDGVRQVQREVEYRPAARGQVSSCEERTKQER